MNVEQMAARIAQLEGQLRKPARRVSASAAQRAMDRENRKRAKDAEKARKAQFKLEAWKRAHLHSTINRYHL